MGLVSSVHNLLQKSKPELADKFKSNYNAQDGFSEIISLNQYFRKELLKAPISTLDERECLIDDLSDNQWLMYFETHVLPTLVRFNLPT